MGHLFLLPSRLGKAIFLQQPRLLPAMNGQNQLRNKSSGTNWASCIFIGRFLFSTRLLLMPGSLFGFIKVYLFSSGLCV